RSDLFSLAATLYALGNGRPMVPKDPVQARQGPPRPRCPPLPGVVDEVLAIPAAADPRERFGNALQMRAALLHARSQVNDQQARFAVQALAVDVPTDSFDAADAAAPDVEVIEGESTE